MASVPPLLLLYVTREGRWMEQRAEARVWRAAGGDVVLKIEDGVNERDGWAEA